MRDKVLERQFWEFVEKIFAKETPTGQGLIELLQGSSWGLWGDVCEGLESLTLILSSRVML